MEGTICLNFNQNLWIHVIGLSHALSALECRYHKRGGK